MQFSVEQIEGVQEIPSAVLGINPLASRRNQPDQ
jgi:hypothetical protein